MIRRPTPNANAPATFTSPSTSAKRKSRHRTPFVISALRSSEANGDGSGEGFEEGADVPAGTDGLQCIGKPLNRA